MVISNRSNTIMNNIFHVHTCRCKHSSNKNDEDYVKTTLSLGVEEITFTDHWPFPGNPFKNRMDIEELTEYIGCCNAMIEGMKSGFFSIVTHPDRIFRHCKKWTPELTDASNKLIDSASQCNIMLEKNLSSYEKLLDKSSYKYWRKEF